VLFGLLEGLGLDAVTVSEAEPDRSPLMASTVEVVVAV
jgi:hypothetical protein